jgi:poly(3-hydroxybutyrate) depolymerase
MLTMFIVQSKTTTIAQRRGKTFPHVVLAVASAAIAALSVAVNAVRAQGVGNAILDEAAAPGKNYAKAEFRLWYPIGAGTLQATLVLVPGSNGDGRSEVEDPMWQAFAARHKLALVGCYFTDKPHEQSFIEQYVEASQGSGQALLDALSAFAGRAGHPELATAPLLLWGMSAGGEFNYEFVAWKPDRVVAFVVNKGGIYYTALMPRAARNVPGMLFVGGKDLEFRTNTIVGLFAVNRRAGALWALAEEHNESHAIGRSRDAATIFFEDVLPLRMGEKGLRPLREESGFLGDFKLKTFQAFGDGGAPNYPTAWLPTERVARAWQAIETEQPFEH